MNLEKVIISNDKNVYEAWPDIVKTNTGKMICVFAECTHHLKRDYTAIVYCISMDDGQTWTPKKILVKALPKDDFYYNCPRIQQLKDGRLLILVDKVLAGGERMSTPYVCFYYSEDDGVSWSDEITEPEINGIVPDKIQELENGRWFLACHIMDKEFGFWVQRAWYSDDRGDTWHGPVTVGKQDGLNLCEASIIETKKALVAFMRETSGYGLDCYKAISYDNGESWGDLIQFPLPGCHRPVAGFLKNGKILITYRFLQGGTSKSWGRTQNLFGAFTDLESALSKDRDGAFTKIFPIDHDFSENADTGYSGWVELDNGDIYIVNYIMECEKEAFIKGYRLTYNHPHRL